MAKPPPPLTPTSLPVLVPTPGVLTPTDQEALRCPNCNRVILCPRDYIEANPGGVVACPLCGGGCSIPK